MLSIYIHIGDIYIYIDPKILYVLGGGVDEHTGEMTNVFNRREILEG